MHKLEKQQVQGGCYFWVLERRGWLAPVGEGSNGSFKCVPNSLDINLNSGFMDANSSILYIYIYIFKTVKHYKINGKTEKVH